jgi:hypothetical protein
LIFAAYNAIIVLRDDQKKLKRGSKNMSDILTAAEIHSKFRSDWALVENFNTNESLEVQSGHVLYHSQDRDEVYRKAVELRPKRFAMLYTGSIPEGTAVIL